MERRLRRTAQFAELLKPIRYRAFVDHTGATISTQSKRPDPNQVPIAAQLEEADRNLIQMGRNNWVPYAYGEVLPVAPTIYRFEKTVSGYDLSMRGQGITGRLVLDQDLHVIGGVLDTTQHIEITTTFVHGSKGLVLAASSTHTDHAGVARFTYTYQSVDAFQLPQRVGLSSEANRLALNYTLTDCRAEHGIVIHVAPPSKPY